MNLKVNIVGDVFNKTGYSAHVKGLIQGLQNNGVSVSVETSLPQGWEFECPDKLMEAIKANNRNEINIMVSLPHAWPMKLSERPKRFIGFLVFEGNTIPLGWKSICNRKDVDQVWVPSVHVKNAAIKGGVIPKKIRVVPHGVDTKTYHPLKDKNITPPEVFSFLFVGGWSQGEEDRKNLPFLLRAFCEEFGKDEQVELVCKINPAYNPPGYDFEEAINSLELGDDRPNIRVNTVLISEGDLNKIYNECSVFVCPSKAEGFGLTMLEAMACGKSVITGGYGGQIDFVNSSNGWVLDKFKLVPSRDRMEFYEGVFWADYPIEDLRNVLRVAFEADLTEKEGNALSTATSMTWNRTGRVAIKWLEKLK